MASNSEEHGREERVLALQVGDEVPDFFAESTVGCFRYHDMIDGIWNVLISLADVFHPVSTTEIGHLAKLCHEFEARNARIFGIVPEANLPLLRRWIKQVEELEACTLNFALISDPDQNICSQFGVSSKAGTALIITDIDKRIRFISQYPISTGRNFFETIRVLDALQLAFFQQVATPANWSHGLDLFLQPQISTLAARATFPKGIIETRHWFRITPPVSHNSAAILSNNTHKNSTSSTANPP
uniref:Thioredoxin domain-containing protein n=1 Tax=Aureoumbra lagunensis TaxID=44058 RepID=A0A7S3K173_9STRA|mmetsp:Transcript_27/g.48  ORF Transcript_27/g.48 Transcript_27/m.48 type:complete len:243 (-) Transcript_27:176-904(-)